MDITYHRDNSTILERLARRSFDKKEWFDLKTQGERLSVTEGFDRLLTLEVLDLELFDHQRRAVLRVLRELRGRAVLADEVGLGKTVEAGVVLKEYLLRSLVTRVLVLVPASLVTQWRSELREKLGITMRVGRTPKDFQDGERVLASIDMAKRGPCMEAVLSGTWDMVIVDEAHRLKNQKTLNWRFVNSVQKKYLLLLTATPIQNDLRELYNLVTLLKPGQLKTYSHFKRAHMVDKHSPKNTAELKAQLSEVMIRSGRRESLLPFPRREVETVTVPLSASERRYYNEVLQALRSTYEAQPKEERNLLPLILVLREACSHPLAAQKTLRAMSARRFLPTLKEATLESWEARLAKLKPAKVQALLRLFRAKDASGIVFTEFRLTQAEVARALRDAGVTTHVFHGGMSGLQKDEAVAAFKRDGGVLVSTESGGEGRNLQFCSTVVNYDLPWNPMRVEQRIGRVHRLGQRSVVRVVNMVTEGTIDRYVLYLLDKKIDMFHRVVGEIDEILEGLEGGFERRIAEAAFTSGTDEELSQKIEAFGADLERAYHRYDRVRALNRELFAPLDEGE